MGLERGLSFPLWAEKYGEVKGSDMLDLKDDSIDNRWMEGGKKLLQREWKESERCLEDRIDRLDLTVRENFPVEMTRCYH